MLLITLLISYCKTRKVGEGYWLFLNSTKLLVLQLFNTNILRLPRYIIVAWLAISPAIAHSQIIEVGLFHYHKIPEVFISVNSGDYELWGDGYKIVDMPFDAIISIRMNKERESLEVKGLNRVLGYYHNIHIKSTELRGTLKLKAVKNPPTVNIYDGELLISLGDDKLKMINRVDIDSYVAGTVEKEIGPSANMEYYKIQAVICRTYALSNLNRHKSDGYQVCDEVHCQAYDGKSRKRKEIIIATAATSGMVLTDDNNQLILAAYHSNCGGETRDAAQAWRSSRSYLQPIKDTFCLDMGSAKWEVSITREEWDKYLTSFATDQPISKAMVCFYQNERMSYYNLHGVEVPIKQIRKDWRLRSSFFDIEEASDGTMTISGRGYGHGVGLCQQGALRMTELGHTYREVLDFYFNDVRLVNYSSVRK